MSGPVIPASERQLKRDIGFFGAAFIAFNGAIGAGIFALPGRLHAEFGGFAPWLFPIFGLLILVIALPFGRVASHYPVSGGPVRYAARFGPLVSFQAGWLLWVARVTAVGANLNLLANYGGAAWAPLGTGAGRAALILCVCALIGSLNYSGVRRGMGAINLLTLLKTVPLVGVALLGLWLFADSIPSPGPPPPFGALESAALLVLYAFVGFETAVLPAGEMRDPGRMLSRAMVVTLMLIILLYFLIQLAYGAAMPVGPAPEAPLAALGAVVAGAAGALILTAGAAFSILGNVANALLSAPRLLFALGVDGLLPSWFGRVHARYATPANAVAFTTGAIVLLALTGSFVWLAAASTLARLIVYGLSVAALPGVERESETVGERSGGRVVVTWLMVVAALGVCLWAMLQSDWTQWRVLLALAAGGVALYFAAARSRRKMAAEPGRSGD
ncbi:APC family permease [Brevundimonas lenta]|uniref:Amino acid transporter n=1 Tax=Brevundimonas lenta TaxID=424796 RepID=A0A7W6JEB8_9CAUL|nr:APC family permease [Brevundimonas lenta]MBB4083573.1 amino acid transporter [Brevundimonas lenta]